MHWRICYPRSIKTKNGRLITWGYRNRSRNDQGAYTASERNQLCKVCCATLLSKMAFKLKQDLLLYLPQQNQEQQQRQHLHQHLRVSPLRSLNLQTQAISFSMLPTISPWTSGTSSKARSARSWITTVKRPKSFYQIHKRSSMPRNSNNHNIHSRNNHSRLIMIVIRNNNTYRVAATTLARNT